MKKHFVTFMSPGTLVSETSTKPIDSWDIKQATEMAHKISERYSATPYAFHFTTRSRTVNDLDSKQVAISPTYFLGGTVLTLQDIKDRNDRKDRILIRNMEGNGYDRVIENNNSWKITLPLAPDDVVLDFTPEKLE